MKLNSESSMKKQTVLYTLVALVAAAPLTPASAAWVCEREIPAHMDCGKDGSKFADFTTKCVYVEASIEHFTCHADGTPDNGVPEDPWKGAKPNPKDAADMD